MENVNNFEIVELQRYMKSIESELESLSSDSVDTESCLCREKEKTTDDYKSSVDIYPSSSSSSRRDCVQEKMETRKRIAKEDDEEKESNIDNNALSSVVSNEFDLPLPLPLPPSHFSSDCRIVLSEDLDKQQQQQQLEKALFRSAMIDLTCLLYAILIIVVGCVLALANALTQKLDVDAYYLQAFNVYIYSVSLLFLIYLHLYVLHLRPKWQKNSKKSISRKKIKFKNTENLTKKEDCREISVKSNSSSSSYAATISIRTDDVEEDAVDSTFSSTISSKCSFDCSSSAAAAVTYDAPGVNFYLRLGAIGFGLGAMLQDGFRILQRLEDQRIELECHEPFSTVTVLLHVIVVFFQTFFIFKSHKIVLNLHEGLVKFGLMNIVAANVCLWFAATVYECQKELTSPTNVTNDDREMDNSQNYTTLISSKISSNFDCLPDTGIVSRLSPYLFPCTIEYSLIAAAVVFRIYRNVGRRFPFSTGPPAPAAYDHAESEHGEKGGGGGESIDCHKAHKGLFLGLLVAVLTMIAVSCYFVFGDNLSFYGDQSSSVLFFVTEISLLFCLFISIIVAFFKFQQLRFASYTGHIGLDSSLLIIALCGVFSLECFHLVSALSTMFISSEDDEAALVTVLALVSCILAIVQSVLQTVFIIDGLQRRAIDVEDKPGRAVVLFLLLCNLSLWIVCIFEVKKAENLPIHSDFYGSRPWSIIRHLCVPLIIFFRFHSTVCLSEIWIHAYKSYVKKTTTNEK